MAEKNTQTLDNLNQNNLGDKKLSREEISYIQSKDQLWFKDIGEKLFDDIVSTNEKLLKDNTALKAFIDDIILQPETLRQIAQKAGISLGKVEKMFSEGNQNLDNKINKYYIVVNLLLYGCTKNIFPEVRGNLIDNMNTPAFTGATAKALHKFQKMGEQTQGRSKADCLLGPKTLQQMLSYMGVQTVNQKVDTETFARSNMSAKETYEWNAEQKKQMDIIINDPALTPEQKISFLAKVANKTVDVGSDKLNKKYGAVSYMCQLIANNLMVGTTPEQQESIVAAVLPYETLIKKYWNEKSAVEFGVDPKLVPKTNDFVKDIKDIAKSVESKYQSNTIMAQTALQICSAWISYYQQDNPKGRKKHQSSIETGMKELQSLYDHKTGGDIRQNIAAAMDKIFFDTATKIDFSTVVTDKVIVGGIDIAGSFTSYANLQKRAFKGVKNIFLADKKRTEKESKNAINEAFTAFRYIDKEMDGDFDIGIGEKFRMGTWKTSEGIKSTVENMGMSGLALDVKNAPQEFTNEQNAIKNGVQNIKNALETDPNGSVAQKVDKLLTAIAANDNATIKALIKDAELFGMDVSDKSIKEITKRMQEISKQNEKNKIAVFNDMKKNYNKVYEQMKGTQLWLREQGRGDEADMLEGNKQVFEALINGGVVTNPPEGLEQFTGKTLDNIATEEIRKMERMQLTGVLEVGLMRGLMMKYEDMLKTLAEKTGLSADENLLKLYADIDGFDGSWKDETCNIVGSIAAEILITIIVCVLTAGIGGIIVNSVLKGAQGIFKAVRWGKTANAIARFGQLGNTSLKVIRTATGVSKTVKTTQTAAKILYRTTALLAEAPAFNTVSKMIHNGIEGNSLLAGINLNPIAKENIQTAAFLGVMHGFSVVRGGVVLINFGKAGEVFAKSPQFLKSASSVAGEFTTMMASEQVMNLTFGREIPDPNDPTKTIIERGIHIPEKKDVIQMVGMILGMRASAKFNLWPKIEARLKTGEFTVLKIEKNDVVIADKSGNKMKLFADQAKVKDAIEMKKANAEQRKIDKEANDGKQSQAQKNIDMVVRMKTRNAPNKTGTRLGKEYRVSKNTSKDIAKAAVLEKNPLLEIKSNMKATMEYIGLTKSNVVTIEGKKHMFFGVKEGKALFVEKGVAGATPKEFSTVESMKDINFEPGSKETNSGRKAKFDELINAKEVVVVELQNSVVEKSAESNAKNNIESQFNNFDKSPSQKKLDSFNKWYEKQSLFELEVLQAQELMRGVDQKLLSKAMITLMNAKDISQLSSNDIKRVQKEIGIQPKNADGIRGPKSQAKLEALLLKSGAGKKTTFNLERGGAKSKRNIEKTSITEEIPGLGTYEYSKRNNWLRLTLKTPHGTMEAEAHNLTSNEFILHADIGNNRLVAGKAYKFIFDKLPEGAKIMEKNNLSGDSYTNLLKLYQKGNTSEYKIYAGGYVELNLQGKNSSLSKLIIENRIPEEGTISAFFKTKMAAQNVVAEIAKSTSGLGLPEPRIVERPDGTFVIELPNIIIEKTTNNVVPEAVNMSKSQEVVDNNILTKTIEEYSDVMVDMSQASEGTNHISVLNKVITLIQKGSMLPKQFYLSLKKSFDTYILKYSSAINKAIATENSNIVLKDIKTQISKHMIEEAALVQKEKTNNMINGMKEAAKKKNTVENDMNVPKIEFYKNQYKEREKNAMQAMGNIKSINAKIIDIEKSNVAQNIKDAKINLLIKSIEKEQSVIHSTIPYELKSDIRNELYKNGTSLEEAERIAQEYATNTANIFVLNGNINTQFHNTQYIPGLGTFIHERFKHRDFYTIENDHGRIQLESIGNNLRVIHAGLRNRLLAGKAYNFLFEKLPVGSRIMETVSLSGDSYTNLVKLYKKGGDVDCGVGYDGFIKLSTEGESTVLSKLLANDKHYNNGRLYYETDIATAQTVIDAINKDLAGTDLPKAQYKNSEQEGLVNIYVPNIVLTKLEGNLPGFIRGVDKTSSIEDIYQFLDKVALDNIKFSDIKLSGQQLKDRIMQYQTGKLDISFIPKELRDKIISFPAVVEQKKIETK